MNSVDNLREALGDCVTEAGCKDKFDTYWITKDAADKEYKTVETCERVRDDASGLDVPHNGWYVCSKCGEPLPIMNRYCGGCGAIVRKVGA